VPFPSRSGRSIPIGAVELSQAKSDLREAISTETLKSSPLRLFMGVSRLNSVPDFTFLRFLSIDLKTEYANLFFAGTNINSIDLQRSVLEARKGHCVQPRTNEFGLLDQCPIRRDEPEGDLRWESLSIKTGFTVSQTDLTFLSINDSKPLASA
jgi:hypothetical protein